MREHPNTVRIRGLFQAFRDRDLAAIQAEIPEHAVWYFPGRRHGRKLDSPTCLRMRIQDGRIVEVWEFVWDLYAVDEFWA